MNRNIEEYNKKQEHFSEICTKLATFIDKHLAGAEAKVWHAHPVWFINENPIVGFSVQKPGVRLMFWSGKSFEEPALVGTSRFKDASVFYTTSEEINEVDLLRWLKKAEAVQWDYKNIVKRKGELKRLR